MFAKFANVIPFDSETRVIDVGVTPDQTLEDSNFFEALYPFPHQITATSIEDASHLERLYPGLTFLQTDGKTLPFPDNAFDIGFSSAVLEHVGDASHQRQFVSELRRVSKRFFLTTPNRWFPVEVHTFIPLLHWLPQRVHQRIFRAIGLHFWSQTENLNLLSGRALLRLFDSPATVGLGRHRTFGWTSNLFAWGPKSRPSARSDSM